MDAATLVMIAGGATWLCVLAWAIARWRRTQEERELERSMRLEELIGPALAGGSLPASSGATGGLPAPGGVAAAVAPDPVRLAEAMMAAQSVAMERSASRVGLPSSARSSSALMPEAAILRAPPFLMRDRLLDKPATLAFYAIRTALPDHEVFARVSLADLLDVPESVQGYDRAQRLKKLAPLTVDFAVTNKVMQLVAVIDLEDAHATAEQRELQRTKAECLRGFPVRHLTFSRTRLPKYQDIRQLLQRPD